MARTDILLQFKKLVLEGHNLNTDNDMLTARVYFDVVVAGKTWPGQEAQLKLTAGADFETDKGAIEVDGYPEYDGPKNYQGFHDAVEAYYRYTVGSTGRAIHIKKGAGHLFWQHDVYPRSRRPIRRRVLSRDRISAR